MCYKEFIAYQCGHRSVSVMRPCPMTTAGHNFPVCGITPDKPHYAETMCAACERQLHSRWVLIREWEHRWLHERGVCGCEVVFPGLLNTPRVIGETAVAGSAASAAGENDQGGVGPSRTHTMAAPEGYNNRQPRDPGHVEATTAASVDNDGHIPALFTEEVTPSGEHHVAVRLPGLYAAEWQADHRALHDTGKCSCPTGFQPHQPQIRDDELTPHDREALHHWRELAAEKRKEAHSNRGIERQTDETTQRIDEIRRLFGEFNLEGETPKVNLPPLGGRASADNSRGEARGQTQGHGNGNGNGRHHRRFENRHERANPSQPPNQPTQTFTSPEQGQLVPVSQTTTPYSPPAIHHQGYPYAYPLAPFNQPPVTGYIHPDYAPHHPQPHHFTPAHPTYATPATFTDTIPSGAYPWVSEPQKTPGMPWMTQGPGPYRTPGLSYPNTTTSQQSNSHAPIPVHRQLPAPEHHANPTGKGKGKQVGVLNHNHNHSHSGSNDSNIDSQYPRPLCGLPIGAGPEGTSHMPSWEDCPLRGSSSASTVQFITAGGGGEGEGYDAHAAGVSELDGVGIVVAGGQQEEQGHWQEDGMAYEGGGLSEDQMVDGGEEGRGGEDLEEDGEYPKAITPPPRPPRPHSAPAT